MGERVSFVSLRLSRGDLRALGGDLTYISAGKLKIPSFSLVLRRRICGNILAFERAGSQARDLLTLNSLDVLLRALRFCKASLNAPP